MIHKRRVLLNAVMSGLQVVVGAGVMFVLYRFLVRELGADGVGVWGLVLAWTSIGGIADVGIGGSVVKFVSQHEARGDREYVNDLIQTAVISVAVLAGLVLGLAYPVVHWLLSVLISSPSDLVDAQGILPYAIVSFWLTTIARAVLSCIDGYQRVYLRNLLMMVAMIGYLIAAYLLVRTHGIIGVAVAHLVQAIFVVVASWVVLRIVSPSPIPALPNRWARRAFREMLGYSVNFQIVSISQLLFEPVTKSILTRFVGLDAAGMFEIANKMVIQIRGIIINAYQSIVPAISDLYERRPHLIRDIYQTSLRLLLFVVVAGLPLLIGLVPSFSRYYFGETVESFVIFADLLIAGWFINILSAPAYFVNLGIGELRWNVIDHLTTSFLNVVLALVAGWFFGGVGIVFAFVIALVAGSGVLVIAYHRRHQISFSELFQRETVYVALAGVVGLASALMIETSVGTEWPAPITTLVLLVMYGFVMIVPVWRHPIRMQLSRSLVELRRG